MAWQSAFNNWGPVFGQKGAGWNAVTGHKGTDLRAGGGGLLPAWEKLTVINSDYFSSNLGYGITVRCEHGFEFDVAHGRKGTRPANGTVLEPGDQLMLAASGPKSLATSNVNFPGKQWEGTHFHICMRKGGSAFDSGLLDARPHIVQCLAAPAALDLGYGLTTEAQRESQRALKKLGLYSGPDDGVFGPLSVKGFQQHLKNIGLLGAGYDVDGVPGPMYGEAVQKLAAQYGYTGPIDKVPGTATSAGIVKWAEAILSSSTPTPVPPVPVPPTPITPPVWAKTYPGSASVHPSPNRSVRDPLKGGTAIRYIILHFTANPVDHTGYFTRVNERSVAPHLYSRPSGEVKEFVRLSERAYTTAVALDHEAVTWEIESGGTFTEAQYTALAAFAAWLAQQKTVDGFPVEFLLDRQHVLGHKEVPGVTSGTNCPAGLDIDRIVREAKVLLPKNDKVLVDRTWLEAAVSDTAAVAASGRKYLEGIS